MFVGIFTAIKIFNWIGTLYRGSIRLTAPLVYVLGFLFLLMFGGMTGVAVATVGLDVYWHDTYFVVAHFHFIMVGASLMAFLAGLHYWFPKMFGRLYSERWAFMAAWLNVFGFAATFIPQFLLGNAGMPRRYFQYEAHFQALHVASTAGASLLAIGFTVVLVVLLLALIAGPRASANPWHSGGFEWLTASPPPEHNFTETPTFHHRPHEYFRPEVG
jgi:cytochrome c oxidase subunit 1